MVISMIIVSAKIWEAENEERERRDFRLVSFSRLISRFSNHFAYLPDFGINHIIAILNIHIIFNIQYTLPWKF